MSRLSLPCEVFCLPAGGYVVLMLGRSSVSEASVASGVLAFSSPVSLSFCETLNRVCVLQISVVIYCDYAGALLRCGDTHEQRHSIIL